MTGQQKTRVTVEIHGQTYTIVGTEPAAHVRHVAALVDERMQEISKNNRRLDIKKNAVLTAVNSMSEYLKLEEKLKKLEMKTERLEQELKKIKD